MSKGKLLRHANSFHIPTGLTVRRYRLGFVPSKTIMYNERWKKERSK